MVHINYKYWVLFRGKLASRKLTLAGAKQLKRQLIKEKGWMASEIEIVHAPSDEIQERNN